MPATNTVEIRETLPPGKITGWPEWGDAEEDDWIIGVRHSPNQWTQIALCPTKGIAKLIAAHLNMMKRRPP